MKNRAFEVNQRILREHLDYLYGKINLAYQYLDKKQYDKITEVLGPRMEISELCPDRDIFHLNEVACLLRVAIRYFCATGNLQEAEARFELLDQLDPDHPDTDLVYNHMVKTQNKVIGDRLEEEIKRKHRVLTGSHNKRIQTNTPPDFSNGEISLLYTNSLDISRVGLELILSLPRDKLISDLITVLTDSMARFEHFMRIADKRGWQEEIMSFPIHAVFLLGELRATQGLPVVLDTLRQGDEFIEFWYGDFISGGLWEPLYYMGNGQLDMLMEFVLAPGIWKYARTEVCDSDFSAFAIWDVVELRAVELLPEIGKLYDLGYVSTDICGSYEAVKEDIKGLPTALFKRELKNIFDRYQEVYEKKETEPPVNTLKTGRNEPCPLPLSIAIVTLILINRMFFIPLLPGGMALFLIDLVVLVMPVFTRQASWLTGIPC